MPTNVFDVTFPPDTQLANLLGSDIRTLKLDIQQRMGLISGTLGARWNPGADAQPTNWTGLLYFATDTQQVFQWSGSAWVQVSAFGGYRFEGSNIVPVTVANTVTPSFLQGISLQANDIGAGQTFYVDCAGVMGAGPSSGQSLIVNLFLDSVEIDGGNSLSLNLAAANNQLWGLRLFFTCLTAGATGTIQRPNMLFSYLTNTFNNNAAVGGGFTLDTTSAHTLQLKVTWGAATTQNTITQNTMTCYRIG